VLTASHTNPTVVMDKAHSELIAAAYGGRLADVKRLVQQDNCDPDKPDAYKGSTALHWACRGGRLDVAQWLVEQAGADPAARNQVGLFLSLVAWVTI
jgi:ankyrin repeat protein